MWHGTENLSEASASNVRRWQNRAWIPRGAFIEPKGNYVFESGQASARMGMFDENSTVVHRRMDEIIAEVGGMKTDIATIRDDVKDSKKVTDEVEKWKQMGIGALGVTLANSVEWVARFFRR